MKVEINVIGEAGKDVGNDYVGLVYDKFGDVLFLNEQNGVYFTETVWFWSDRTDLYEICGPFTKFTGSVTISN